jgi:hypothetical protein
VIDRLSHFWTTDRSLSVFLWLLLIAVFILAPLADREGMLFASAGFSVLLISGVLLVAKNRMTRGLVTVTALIRSPSIGSSTSYRGPTSHR